jgi:hypothetical protein
MKFLHTSLSCFLCLAWFSATAQENEPEKGKSYNLFNPVPKSEMREFSIDRPDVTESPMTVDAGHFQFEGDIFKVIKQNQRNGDRAFSIVNGLYKMGLSDSWDIQFGLSFITFIKTVKERRMRKDMAIQRSVLSITFGEMMVTTRTALGMIPYITLPTSPVDSEIVYGVGFPFSYTINDALGAGAQFQFDFVPEFRRRTSADLFANCCVWRKACG